MNVLRVDAVHCRAADFAAAVAWLRGGRIVAFPTDTFYGLAVDPASAVAARDLFALKRRSPDDALPLVAASTAQVEAFCGSLTAATSALARRWWPGALSLICDAPAGVTREVHGGTNTIAIRVPDHPVARSLALAWGAPVTATSANRSGQPPARSAAMLGDLASDPMVLVIDGGVTAGGAASTIVDARGPAVVLVREGVIPWSRVLESLQG